MSVEKAKEFLKEYRNNEEAVKIMKQFSEPKSSDEAIAQFVETAGKLGTRITAEDMAKAIRELTEEMKAKTDAVTDDLQAMDDDDLDEAAGGGGFYYYVGGRKRTYNTCYEDYKAGETCFLEDACKYAQVRYYGCSGEGQFYAEGKENGCKLYDIMCDSKLIK